MNLPNSLRHIQTFSNSFFSYQDLVDRSAPTSAIRFRLACRGRDGVSGLQIRNGNLIYQRPSPKTLPFPSFHQDTDYLPVTLYVGDINDHRPEFLNTPYRVTVDEETRPGECQKIFRKDMPDILFKPALFLGRQFNRNLMRLPGCFLPLKNVPQSASETNIPF